MKNKESQKVLSGIMEFRKRIDTIKHHNSIVKDYFPVDYKILVERNMNRIDTMERCIERLTLKYRRLNAN